MSGTKRKPLIGVSACRKQIDPHPFNIVGEKYINGIVDGADAMPMILKAFLRICCNLQATAPRPFGNLREQGIGRG